MMSFFLVDVTQVSGKMRRRERGRKKNKLRKNWENVRKARVGLRRYFSVDVA